ncbi:prephenate dehydrogenase [Caldisphaera lagunensis DSM 15908]|uniref:Prephenate dehydrogenase n=1 Tax=Caldisphaera lagunensis (strain DSM 15908 / JCM 11604 / ANMR 0165 / IC-154) TaxID=1056495 RepID=L0A956_CALLD|nr:NAD(P)-binding domain-containing protein [Caldisphaera lagunensis]AFZ70428.1 prephenate dehydrogenase [Caldisphaera lagunensis DSM 15908]
MRVGIIGYGKMGQVFSNLFQKHGYNVIIYDTKLKHEKFKNFIKKSDYIMISVSPNNLKRVINRLINISKLGYLDGKLIFDISTFKDDIIHYYSKFSDKVMIGSIHPLFGPGIKDPSKHYIAIIPLKENDGSKILEDIFSNMGFKVFYVNYKTHDELISITIGLSYIIGISINKMLNSYDKKMIENLSGTTFKYLKNHYLSIYNDIPDFANYILSNKRVKNTLKNYINVLKELEKNKEDVLKELEKNKNDIEIRNAYNSLYDCIEKY